MVLKALTLTPLFLFVLCSVLLGQESEKAILQTMFPVFETSQQSSGIQQIQVQADEEKKHSRHKSQSKEKFSSFDPANEPANFHQNFDGDEKKAERKGQEPFDAFSGFSGLGILN